jgi:hypothetical protein
VFAKSGKFEVLIVYLKSEPWPFRLSGFSLVLMEIFKRFCLLGCDVIVLWFVIKNFLYVTTAMHGIWLAHCSSSIESCFVGETSLKSSEFVDVEFLSGFLHSMYLNRYFLFFLSAR